MVNFAFCGVKLKKCEVIVTHVNDSCPSEIDSVTHMAGSRDWDNMIGAKRYTTARKIVQATQFR